MSNLRFDGRVAIVTGAGGALGRAYALLLASRGASVVVNDLGVPMAGAGESKGPAQKVVDEITKAGGKAVANYDNVLDGEKIVAAAIAAFGRIDIVINNAGILRDVSFVKMTQEQWDIIHRVHLEGAFKVTKAAWPHMQKQKYGRIIQTSSSSGLYGSGGQANYASAKLALVGFNASLAKEGAKNGVLCNVIAPVAGSRMTETVMPPDFVAALDPKYVAPLVAFLCHESCTVNGGVFESGAGWCTAVRFQRSEGVHFPINDGKFTPEAIASQWDKVSSFEQNSQYPKSLNDSMGIMISHLGKPSSTPGFGKPQVSARAASASSSSLSVNLVSGDKDKAAWKSDAVFADLSAGVASSAAINDKLNAVFVYNITRGKGDKAEKKSWTANLKKNGGKPGTVYEGLPKDGLKTDVTIDVSDDDYVALAAGKASAQMLFMKGRLKMKGNLQKAMLFDSTIKQAQKDRAEKEKNNAAAQPIKSKL